MRSDEEQIVMRKVRLYCECGGNGELPCIFREVGLQNVDGIIA